MKLIISVLLIILFLTACSGYKVKDNKVYWKYWNEGSGSGEKLIVKADAASFTAMEHDAYGKDKNQAYYQGNLIQDIDAESFKSIYRYYAIDKYRAYMGKDIIKNADGATFKVVEGNWGRDSKDYYFKTDSLNVCDYDSLKIYDFKGKYSNDYAVDSKCAYFGHRKIPVKDKESFSIIIAGYAKDKYSVYYESSVLEGADAATFEMKSGTFVGKDKNQCYLFGRPEPCNL